MILAQYPRRQHTAAFVRQSRAHSGICKIPDWAWKRKKLSPVETERTWAAPSEFGTYRLCEQRRFRRACASAQSRQNLRCSLIQAVSQEEPSDRKPDPWPLWMAGHAQLKFVMTECSKTQIRLARLTWRSSMMHYRQFMVPPCLSVLMTVHGPTLPLCADDSSWSHPASLCWWQFMVPPCLSVLMTVHGPTLPLCADDSTLLTEKDAILERWAEHFHSVLSRPSTISDNASNRLPQVECNVRLDEFQAVTETTKAIQHLVQLQCLLEVYQWQRNLHSCFTACGGKKLSRKNSRVHP